MNITRETLDIQSRVSAINNAIAQLDAEILEIKIETPIKGAIIYRMIKCGKPKCDCKIGPAYYHGPYPHLEWIEDGKVKTKYLNKKIFDQYKEQLDASKRLKALLAKRESLAKQRAAIEKKLKKHLRQVSGM